MEEIFEQFKDKDAFDAYWKEHYVPLTYEDVREAYEDFVKSADKASQLLPCLNRYTGRSDVLL